MIICRKCQQELPSSANYCLCCGAKIVTACKSKFILVLILSFVCLFMAAYFFSAKFVGLGTKPTQTYDEYLVNHSSIIDNEKLDQLRNEVNKDPSSLEAKQLLARELSATIRQTGQVPTALYFELIDLLRNIIKLNPEDTEAILSLADLSFEKGVFDIAAQYYVRVLQINPNAYSVRARYASSLSMQGEFSQAENELQRVIKEVPDDFAAHAYLSVNLARQGETQEALKMAQKAIALAPTAQAKEEIIQLSKRIEDGEFVPRQEKEQAIDDRLLITDWQIKLTDLLKDNPVIAPKLVAVQIRDQSTLAVLVKDFPMETMPQVAKDKLSKRLKELFADRQISVVFVDSVSKQTVGQWPWLSGQ